MAGVVAFPRKLFSTVSAPGDLLAPYPISVRAPFIGLIYGRPATGKTSFLLRVGAWNKGGPTLYFANENGFQIANQYKRLGLPPRPDFFIDTGSPDLEEVMEAIKNCGARIVLLDTPLPSHEIVQGIMDHCKATGVSALFAAHVWKDGQIGGPEESTAALSRAADLVIRVDRMKWQVEKNRFDGPSSGNVL